MAGRIKYVGAMRVLCANARKRAEQSYTAKSRSIARYNITDTGEFRLRYCRYAITAQQVPRRYFFRMMRFIVNRWVEKATKAFVADGYWSDELTKCKGDEWEFFPDYVPIPILGKLYNHSVFYRCFTEPPEMEADGLYARLCAHFGVYPDSGDREPELWSKEYMKSINCEN